MNTLIEHQDSVHYSLIMGCDCDYFILNYVTTYLLIRDEEGATENLKVNTVEVQLKNFCHEVEGSFHPRICSAEWLLMVDDDASSSIGEAEPQPPPSSAGSMTLTEPSAKPTANWFCTCGFAAMTSGYRSSVLQYSTPHD